MENERKSGVLLPLSSINGEYAVGVMGKNARAFIDKISKAGFSFWQILPFGTTDEKNSPYCSSSAFAGNIIYIDPDSLYEKGLVTLEDVKENIYCGSPYTANYKYACEKRLALMKKAYQNLRAAEKEKLSGFCKRYFFAENFSLYMALKEKNGFLPWYEWDDEYKFYDKAKKHTKELAEETGFWCFVQYMFFEQWLELKQYANERGVKIIGDMPIYVSLDSADVWSNTDYFLLDKDTLKPKKVAGVPPDYFSKTGQKWGNPIYDWEKIKQDDYRWWIKRITYSLSVFDTVRIDHFRAFASYWQVPEEAETAETGEWKKGVGTDFFERLFREIGSPSIIAEDLGSFGEDVMKLLECTGFPGMRVIQFGFDPYGDSTHLPHNYPKNTVAYVGTHDNNTLLGWLYEATEDEREFALRYCGYGSPAWGEGGYRSPACRCITENVWRSSANLAIISLQDMCGFGSDARMNTPGVADGNWLFRAGDDTMQGVDTNYFLTINRLFRRTDK